MQNFGVPWSQTGCSNEIFIMKPSFLVELLLMVQIQTFTQLQIVLLHFRFNKTHLHQNICEVLGLLGVLMLFVTIKQVGLPQL